MVKTLDEINSLPDHVGWRLWQANRAWQTEFVAAMRAAGHGWFSEARAGLLGNLPREGIRQAALIERMAIQIVELSHGYLLKKTNSQGPTSRGPSY